MSLDQPAEEWGHDIYIIYMWSTQEALFSVWYCYMMLFKWTQKNPIYLFYKLTQNNKMYTTSLTYKIILNKLDVILFFYNSKPKNKLNV